MCSQDTQLKLVVGKDMQNSEVRDKIYALLKKHSKLSKEIKSDFDILADTGLDSVSVMDIVMELEDELDIMIPIENLSNVRTVGDFEAIVFDIINNEPRGE